MFQIGADRFRSKAAASREFGTGRGGGGEMGDVSRRLGAVEAGMSSLREQVAELRGKIEQFAIKADLHALKADLNALEARLIYWIVGTALTLGIAQHVSCLFGL
jgi:hypothetical protein